MRLMGMKELTGGEGQRGEGERGRDGEERFFSYFPPPLPNGRKVLQTPESTGVHAHRRKRRVGEERGSLRASQDIQREESGYFCLLLFTQVTWAPILIR